MNLDRHIVFFIGPTGAGKGTQSLLLEESCGFKHLETSLVIEDTFKERPDDPEIIRAKEIWISGELLPSPLMASWIMGSLKRYLESGNVVMSGSPRRVEEVLIEMPEIEKIVKKENIITFHLPITIEEAIERNIVRRLCVAKRHPIPGYGDYAKLDKCPRDGSDLVKRDLDTPEIIKERYRVYLEETYPVIEYFRDNGYRVIDIESDSIDNMHKKIQSYIKDVCHP